MSSPVAWPGGGGATALGEDPFFFVEHQILAAKNV